MRIAVVDVAAESGGALSVLKDFLSYIVSNIDETNEYYVFVSKEVDIVHPHIHYVVKEEIKKSWISRLKWERFGAIKELEALKIDVVFSLQNTAFYSKKIRQIVYFHNVLLLEPAKKYSLMKKEERLFGIYTRVIAPYTIRSLKFASTVICQTNTVREQIHRRNPRINAIAVNPNVYVPKEYIGTALKPIKGFLYPTAPVPFKRIEEVIECVQENLDWFKCNELELLVTISGTENPYAKMIYDMGKDIPCIRYIGYQQREKILNLYKDHALIINSELESFPIPFKEAEYVGTTIVSADYSYAVEILEDIRGAFTYEKHNLQDMFEKMKKAVNYELTENNSVEIGTNTWIQVMEIISNS